MIAKSRSRRTRSLPGEIDVVQVQLRHPSGELIGALEIPEDIDRPALRIAIEPHQPVERRAGMNIGGDDLHSLARRRPGHDAEGQVGRSGVNGLSRLVVGAIAKNCEPPFYGQLFPVQGPKQPRLDRLETDQEHAMWPCVSVLLVRRRRDPFHQCRQLGDAHARQVKYLNNIIEQDYRRIKRLSEPGLGFGSFRTARRTLAGFEAMAMIRKAQMTRMKGTT
jgi:hypothetical protein